MRVAITGATGFVGGHLVRVLTEQGHQVVPFSRSGTGHHQWDIEQGTYPVPPEVDAVVHCAAHVEDWSSCTRAYRANVVGTKHVLHTFDRVPLFIYISSASVYDAFAESELLTEESRCGTYLNAYSKTKHEAEEVVQQATQRKRIILRPHIIYGMGDTKVLPRLLAARRCGRFLVLGDGKNIVSLTHIENLSHAVACCLVAEIPNGCEVFNIADSEPATVDELVNEIRKACSISERIFHIPRILAYIFGATAEAVYKIVRAKNAPLITRYLVAQMAYGHRLSIFKAQKMLHYKPKWNYQKGILDMCRRNP